MKERVGEDRERYFHHPHVSLIAANKAVSVDYLPDKQPHARQLPKDARRNWNRYCIYEAREPSTPKPHTALYIYRGRQCSKRSTRLTKVKGTVYHDTGSVGCTPITPITPYVKYTYAPFILLCMAFARFEVHP